MGKYPAETDRTRKEIMNVKPRSKSVGVGRAPKSDTEEHRRTEVVTFVRGNPRFDEPGGPQLRRAMAGLVVQAAVHLLPTTHQISDKDAFRLLSTEWTATKEEVELEIARRLNLTTPMGVVVERDDDGEPWDISTYEKTKDALATGMSSITYWEVTREANSQKEGPMTDYWEKAGQEDWQAEDGQLTYRGRLVVPDVDNLRTRLIAEVHLQKPTAHPGRNKTMGVLKDQYWWPKMQADVSQYIANCHTCHRSQVPRDKPPGLLQPLEVPERPHQHLTMDFMTLPKDKHGYNCVLVVMDRLSKRSYSIACRKTTTAVQTARLFFDNVWRHTGTPETITSDRGTQFVSEFWDELCKILGIKIQLSTARHPETDGQTEIMNQYLAQRLRPMVNYAQDDWSELLPFADMAQACLPHESTGLSPFMIETGHEPRMSFDWKNRTKKFESSSSRMTRETAQAYAERIHEAWEVAKKEHDEGPGTTSRGSKSKEAGGGFRRRRLGIR